MSELHIQPARTPQHKKLTFWILLVGGIFVSLFTGGLFWVGSLFLAEPLFLPWRAYPNQFQNVPPSSPHALLTCEDVPNWSDRCPTISHINGQKTSFWRSSERFTIPPEPVELRVIANEPPYDYSPLKFTPLADHHYEIRYLDDRNLVGLFDVSPGSSQEPLVIVPRETDTR